MFFLQVFIRIWLTRDHESDESVSFLRPEPSPATTELNLSPIQCPSETQGHFHKPPWLVPQPLPSPVASSTCLFFFSEFLGKQASGEEDRCQERRGKGQ